MTKFVARDKDGSIHIFDTMPSRGDDKWEGEIFLGVKKDEPAFAGVTWESDPVSIAFPE